MMCEECGQREATFHLTSITNNERSEKNLCPICMAKYKKKLPGIDFGNLAGMLAGIMNAAKKKPEEPEEDSEKDTIVCDTCGMTYGEFRKTGMLGCAHCYQAFREPLEEMLNRIHGNAQHTGKVPGGRRNDLTIRMTIDRLKQQLVKSIANEAYEEAAVLRDQIKALTEQLAHEAEKEQNGTC